VTWFDVRFESADDVDTWAVRCQGGCNGTAELSWDESLEALSVHPEWASASDELEIYSTISPEIPDMSGGYAHLRLYGFSQVCVGRSV
jgi:hypothetical protein